MSLQVMRSKLASQALAPAASAVTTSGVMLTWRRAMFGPSLQRMQAASYELRALQRLVRFHASREDVAWAASGDVSTRDCHVYKDWAMRSLRCVLPCMAWHE